MTRPPLTAAQAGLLSCETCGLLAQPADVVEPGYCPRCGARLEWRHHRSIQTTWALVIAAAICYIPANLLPVMETTAFGSTDDETIMGGVVFFAAVVVLTMIAAESFDSRPTIGSSARGRGFGTPAVSMSRSAPAAWTCAPNPWCRC